MTSECEYHEAQYHSREMLSRPGAALASLLTATDARAVAEFVERVRSVLGERVVEIRLFGSKARGDAEPDSDIDVLVVAASGSDVHQPQRITVDIAFDVNVAHNVYISPHVVTADALNDPLQLRGSFLGPALREGIRL